MRAPDGKAPVGRNTTRPVIRICARCDQDTRDPVLVAEIHGNSGPGRSVYACPACVQSFPKQIDPFDLLDAALGSSTAERRRAGEPIVAERLSPTRYFSFVKTSGRPPRFRIIWFFAASNSKGTLPPKS